MSYEKHDYGPLQAFEITWANGHVETIKAHQVTWPDSFPSLFGGPSPSKTPRIVFHGQIDGRWTLVLSVAEGDITRVRNVTQTEPTLLDGEPS